MVKCNKSSTHNQKPVKFRAKSLEGPYFEIADFSGGSFDNSSSNDNKHERENLSSLSPKIMSTRDLISTVGQILDCASRSLSRFQPKESFGSSGTVSVKDNGAHYLVRNDSFGVIDFIDRGYFHVDVNPSSCFSCIMQHSLKFQRAVRRVQYSPYNDHLIENFLWQKEDDSFIKNDIWLKEKNHVNLENICSLLSSYGWMSQISVWPKHRMSESSEATNTVDAFISKAAACHHEMSLSNVRPGNFDMCVDTPNLKDLISDGIDKVILPRKISQSFLYRASFLYEMRHNDFAASLSTTTSLERHLDGHVEIAVPDCIHEPNQFDVDADHRLHNELRQSEKFHVEDQLQSENCSSITNKPDPVLAKQEHAVSGALAGIFVSLCLHPIDTVKTIVQSCRLGQKPICYIWQSVLSERGLPGLYRGITSNITTSAPISAIYTFTYESVKEFLLPSLRKEYYSVAHCTAGACASIATSFVFTPSERIKQQMQVNSEYRNCWSAVQRITEVGGLRSLYAGWGAVLCRNVPHSIIKFYTYESLKRMLMSSQSPDDQPSTLQTLHLIKSINTLAMKTLYLFLFV
ncbi:uncharacterized protein LOC130804861 isoform X2 [Amaranthus tricolor]|uniref:uncharacterized protein LOC130804861 isoform X2 n=1 Tax=Amaranthus tricolor TaxID=29722 RepID=UPI0025872EA0|nr:uncharacterized protein LOC130804861 isoform X2 [Amaranthus tricolor]